MSNIVETHVTSSKSQQKEEKLQPHTTATTMNTKPNNDYLAGGTIDNNKEKPQFQGKTIPIDEGSGSGDKETEEKLEIIINKPEQKPLEKPMQTEKSVAKDTKNCSVDSLLINSETKRNVIKPSSSTVSNSSSKERSSVDKGE